MNDTLHSELASADPAARGEGGQVHSLVRRLSSDARRASLAGLPAREPWWKRGHIMIPLGIAGVVALTGAAVVIPLNLAVNGTQVVPDVEIPISYTTDTGVQVNCHYGIYFGDPANRSAADEQLAEFTAKHDWTGIGQRIYDEAIAHPFVPGPTDDLEVDNQEIRDSTSFSYALSLIIWEEIPVALQHGSQLAGGVSTCTGKLR